MRLPASLALFALLLAVMPRPSEAEALVLPARPPFPGFSSLFQSPSPIVRGPANAASPNAATATVAPPPVMPNATGTTVAGAICRPALIAAEARYGVPTGLLQAIGLVESGRRDEVTGLREPWPWAINAEGEPHFFETKQQAVAWVRQAQSRGIQSIDVGCAQVNLMHHPTAFASLEQAFDPASNADYAARFLRELRDTTGGGNWMTAAGHYHSQTPELAETYRQQVVAAMAHGPIATSPARMFASAHAPASPFGSVEPAPLPGSGLRPEPGRLLPAASGTVGRGLDAYRAMPVQMAVVIRPVPVAAPR